MSPSSFRSQLFCLEMKRRHQTRCVRAMFSKHASGPLFGTGKEEMASTFRRTTVVVPPQIADLVPIVVSLSALMNFEGRTRVPVS